MRLLSVLVLSSAASASEMHPQEQVQEQLLRTPIEHAGWLDYLGRLMIYSKKTNHIDSIIDRLENLTKMLDPKESQLAATVASQLKSFGSTQRADTGVSTRSGKDLYYGLMEGDYRRSSQELAAKSQPNLPAELAGFGLLASLIDYDLHIKSAPMTLWRPHYGLNQEQMTDVLKYAKKLATGQTPESIDHVPHNHVIKARISINMGHPVDLSLFSNDAIEQKLLQAGQLHRKAQHCDAAEKIRETMSIAAGDQQAELVSLHERAVQLCNWKRITRTYKAFCQQGRGGEFPLAEATHGSENSCLIKDAEKMFWTRIWANDCQGALAELDTVRRYTTDEMLRCHQFIASRLEYMRSVQAQCVMRPSASFNTDASLQIFDFLRKKDVVRAQQHWQAVFGSTPDYIEARNLKMAIFVYKFPKAAYSPCMGSAILTGQQDGDLVFLQQVDDVFEGRTREPCQNDQCHIQRMKAHFVSGNYEAAMQHGQKIHSGSSFFAEATNVIACMQLCSHYYDKNQVCRAEANFNQVLATKPSQPKHLLVGIDLARNICGSSSKPTADLYSLKYGTILYPMEIIIKRIREQMGIHPYMKLANAQSAEKAAPAAKASVPSPIYTYSPVAAPALTTSSYLSTVLSPVVPIASISYSRSQYRSPIPDYRQRSGPVRRCHSTRECRQSSYKSYTPPTYAHYQHWPSGYYGYYPRPCGCIQEAPLDTATAWQNRGPIRPSLSDIGEDTRNRDLQAVKPRPSPNGNKDKDSDSLQSQNIAALKSAIDECIKKSKASAGEAKQKEQGSIPKNAPCSGIAESMRRQIEPIVRKLESHCREEARYAAERVAANSSKFVSNIKNLTAPKRRMHEDEYELVRVKRAPARYTTLKASRATRRRIRTEETLPPETEGPLEEALPEEGFPEEDIPPEEAPPEEEAPPPEEEAPPEEETLPEYERAPPEEERYRRQRILRHRPLPARSQTLEINRPYESKGLEEPGKSSTGTFVKERRRKQETEADTEDVSKNASQDQQKEREKK